MPLLIPPSFSPTWVKALRDCSLITPRAERYCGIKAKTQQLAGSSNYCNKNNTWCLRAWVCSCRLRRKRNKQPSLKLNAGGWGGRITTSVNFLKILAFELPGIPQEMWVSSSKPASLVNWYCRNQQRVWLAHKTTGEINCRDSLAMGSAFRAWE